MALKFKAKLPGSSINAPSVKIRAFKGAISVKVAKIMGEAVIKQMKADIAKGKSTIKGRRFLAYRGSYKRQIQKNGFINVGGNRFTKKLKPVNLKLTGAFLNKLRFKVVTSKQGSGVVIGFFDKKSNQKESGHREGANKQAERPIIPLGIEVFNARITKIYLKILNEAIKKIAKRRK